MKYVSNDDNCSVTEQAQLDISDIGQLDGNVSNVFSENCTNQFQESVSSNSPTDVNRIPVIVTNMRQQDILVGNRPPPVRKTIRRNNCNQWSYLL